jgi:hypothetical protein
VPTVTVVGLTSRILLGGAVAGDVSDEAVVIAPRGERLRWLSIPMRLARLTAQTTALIVVFLMTGSAALAPAHTLYDPL